MLCRPQVYLCAGRVKKKKEKVLPCLLPWEDKAFGLNTLQVGRKKENKCVDASPTTLQCCSEVSAKDK